MAIMRIGNRLKAIIFCNEQNIDLFLSLRTGSLNQVCKDLGLNYSHALKLLQIWEKQSLIERNKAGFGYNIFYTLRGKNLFDQLIKLRKYMRRTGIQWGEKSGLSLV